MATGMLKFSPNNTVYIDLDLENHTANKAVDIDAEGVEWPICGGGGGGDYRIIKGTITNSDLAGGRLLFRFMDMDYITPSVDVGATLDIYFPVIGDGVEISGAVFSNVSGDAVQEQGYLSASGDFTANIQGIPA